MLNKTDYVIKELIEKGLIKETQVDEVTKVINNEGKLSKEYQLKKIILDYLTYNSTSPVTEADIEAVYKATQDRFKEGVEITKEHLKVEVMIYLAKEKKANKDPLDELTDSFYKLFNKTPCRSGKPYFMVEPWFYTKIH